MTLAAPRSSSCSTRSRRSARRDRLRVRRSEAGGVEGLGRSDSVEIDFTAGKNSAPQKFKRVADQVACGTTTGGFYYDDPKHPKRIILCPASCEAVREGTAEAKVDVVLGCIKQVN